MHQIAAEDLEAELGRSLWLAATVTSGLGRSMASHRTDGMAEDVHLTSLFLQSPLLEPRLIPHVNLDLTAARLHFDFLRFTPPADFILAYPSGAGRLHDGALVG